MSELIDELLADASERMSKSVEATNHEFGSVRTGRASPALLDRVHVDYYGVSTPLKQLATINAAESQLLTVQPYDKTSLKAIEKGISEANLGLTPSNDGNIIRLVIPQLTEERRRDYIKLARHKGEEAKVSIRNIRRKAKDELDKLVKDGEVGEDDGNRGEKELDATTKKYVDTVDELLKGKESELLEV
jgi:ribosome recycling factor